MATQSFLMRVDYRTAAGRYRQMTMTIEAADFTAAANAARAQLRGRGALKVGTVTQLGRALPVISQETQPCP